MKKEEVISKLAQLIKESKEAKQLLPDQYVVAYYKISDDTLIGYHLSTFCQTTQDILKAKRYQGKDNAGQLRIIYNNLTSTLRPPKEDNIFGSISEKIWKEDFQGMSIDEVYIDAIYLCDGTEPQNINFTIT